MALLLTEPKFETKPHSTILKCNKKNPCQVCGLNRWCTYTDDGSVAFCMRVSAGSVKQARNNSYVHVLNSSTSSPTPTVRYIEPRPIVEKAESVRLHAVYRTLLDILELKKPHTENLMKRGLSLETIFYNGYRSIPTQTEARQACLDLSECFDLSNVPGFYLEEGFWKLNCRGSGILIPYRSIERGIQGLQIRLDNGNVKYIWLSSNEMEGGASSGSPIHYSKPELITDEVMITEGALKADIISEFLNIPVIAMAGVTAVNYDKLAETIKDEFSSVTKAVLAFDADWRTNEYVKAAMQKMNAALVNHGIATKLRVWDDLDCKGYDDYLLKRRG